MAIVGYARVSTTGQSLDTQLEALSGCEKVFREKISGAKDDRPELQQCWSSSGKATLYR
jgi:DNA invertase Pin-like site-specific DNA recombinase